ncbi:S1 RNA-binding domain-containing protein [Malonomonas rubra]|uniref:CvfB family protein n=1 Tax=Malonomonas rubra TaxID=57040 RepID=UPI0026EC9A0F|nr:S1-like domain-containing RNA-binding protein [Malonomonas rubra]
MLPGNYYQLSVEKIEPNGAWLSTDGEPAFLPIRECPAGLATGTTLEVFLFLDRDNRLRATTQEPFAEAGQFALLQVSSIGPHGAFLNWGLEKDLLAPFSEQPQKMLEGRRYLVYLCHDQQGRPIASARLEKFVEKENQDLNEGEEVELLIWTFTDLGAKVIVNDRYEALLYKEDLPTGLKRGDRGKGYVTRIREDKRIDVALRRPGAAGITDAREVILEALQETGFIPLHDNSPPELIRSQLGLSKKQFKKAVGGLYKDGLIQLSHKGLKLLK